MIFFHFSLICPTIRYFLWGYIKSVKLDPVWAERMPIVVASGVNPFIFFLGGGEILSLAGRGQAQRADCGMGFLGRGHRAHHHQLEGLGSTVSSPSGVSWKFDVTLDLKSLMCKSYQAKI